MTRRDFVRNSLLASAAIPSSSHVQTCGTRVFFRLDDRPGGSVLRSFVSRNGKGAMADSLALPRASKLIAHASLPVVFVLLSTDAWQFRSRGAIGSVRYCPNTAQLRGHKITPLSLGATGILNASFLNEARQMVVVTSAGTKNVFQLDAEGALSKLVHVEKTFSRSSGKGYSYGLCTRRIMLDLKHNGEPRYFQLDHGNPEAILA